MSKQENQWLNELHARMVKDGRWMCEIASVSKGTIVNVFANDKEGAERMASIIARNYNEKLEKELA